LKVLKLLFLWVSKDENSLSIFNNFMAWDLWPVEKEVYEAIKWDTLGFGTVDNNHFELTNSSVTSSEEAEEFASKVIEFLKHKNTNLIRLSASSLVDITHKWDCWIVARMFWNDTISKKLILSSKRYYS
jgi:uncharacterized phage-associated protein